MVKQIPLTGRGCIVVAVAVALLLGFDRSARADDRATLDMCKVITDTAAEAARAGDMDAVKRSKPALEKCAAIQREALNKAVQRHLDRQHDAAGSGR